MSKPILAAAAAVSSGACAHPPAPAAAAAAAPKLPSDPASVRHLLGRFAFGPRPGDVARVSAMGTDAWLEQQLEPSKIEDAAGEAALDPYRDAIAPPAELYERLGGLDPKTRDREALREFGGSLQMTALARHIASERQLYEVMVDFWTNHFNVFARKGPTGFAIPDYVERAIRPHALGRFGDLLAATARHPAMLVYLDNFQSVSPEAGAMLARVRKNGPRGINENYARELMELHTLGVDGGYSQEDVIAVARILTGWSVDRPRGGEFTYLFRPRAHDWNEKRALGEVFPAGHGEDEGDRLLALLSIHPSTARHLARKLCLRFVSDTPSDALVGEVAAAYLSSKGEIKPMLRAIAASPELWASAGTKVKSPLRFLASAVRAIGGVSDGTAGLARTLDRLGQPLFGNPVPTGYGDDSRPWLHSGAIVDRMNVALGLASGRLPGVSAELESVVPVGGDLVTTVGDALLGGRAGQGTLAAIRARAAALPNRLNARNLAVAMAIASPEFQRT